MWNPAERSLLRMALKRWTMAALAALVSLCLGCAKPYEPSPMIEFSTVLVDVLQECRIAPTTGGVEGPVTERPPLVAEIEVPRGALLRIDGRISRLDDAGPGPAGPVEFSVEVDGAIVFNRAATSGNRHGSVKAVVPLDRFAGRAISVRLTITDSGETPTKSYWYRVTLERTDTVTRRLADDGPNLLWVLVDTVRADHCGLYGYERPTTPFLDEFVHDAVLYDSAIAPASWTLPSVASLMTGITAAAMTAADGTAVNHRYDLLAEALQRQGITTFAASANPLIGPSHGFDDGFETFHHIPWETASNVSELFERWLLQARGLRWFAYLHFIDPHDPYEAPGSAGKAFADPTYDGIFTRRKTLNELYNTVNYGLPPAHPYTEDDLEYLRATYDQEILYWDSQFKRIVGDLKRNGMLENTIVVVTSDHGEEFTDHGMFKHGHQLFEESVRVPLIIRLPGGILAGRRENRIELFHLRSTLLQLMGFGDGGTSLIDAESDERAHSYTRYTIKPDDPHTRRSLVAVWDGPWKLIRDLDLKRSRLFDLSRDPKERVDLSEIELLQTEALLDELDDWLAANPRSGSEPETTRVSPETEEALRALGYVQ